MDKSADELIRRIADSCAHLSAEERHEYLNRECGNDEELRRRVEMRVRGVSESQTTQTFLNDYEKALPSHYRIIEMLGRGGMGEVFLAEDTRLNRRVAIKFLNSEFRKEPDRMNRFRQEARAASALNHPNILIIHDIGENNGIQYLVSEFIEGEPLRSRIAHGKIPLAEAVGIAAQIASALAASHNAGIVHRDLKPDNVMLRPDGSVKVLDFGLSKDTGSFSGGVDPNANTMVRVSTSPGLILGTPRYMSPEQARGSQLDARTDIFSLAIIIFEMVTGQSPFAGTSMADTLASILTKEPPRLEEYLDDPPPTLISILQKGLRKNRDERYSSMEFLLSDLKDLRRELDARPTGLQQTKGTSARATRQNTISAVASRLMSWPLVLLLVVVALTGGFAWWYFGGIKQKDAGMQGSMRSVGITSWSSRPGELAPAASFSPDARMIAFASTQSGATEIWVKPTAGGDAIQVTQNGFDNKYPIWSPTGQEIAFFSNRGGSHGIWRTSFTGGAQTEIVRGVGPTARPVSWEASGKVYFQEASELFSVATPSTEKTRVTDLGSKGVRARTIELSQDESTIAYSVKDNDLWKVIVERLDGGGSEVMGSSKDQIDHIAWHPNGRNVFFSVAMDGAYQIFQAGDGNPAPVQLSNGNSDFYIQDISVDGSKILYGSVSETSDIWTVNTQDSKQALVTDDVTAEFWPDFSADGKDVVFQSVIQADRPFSGSINIKSKTGSGRPTVVATAGFSPLWSNDGQWIAYFRRTEAGLEIRRVRPTGDEAVKLADGAVNASGYSATPYLKVDTNHISWSPDSRSLAYSAKTDGVSNIRLAAVDGGGNIPLTENKDPTDTYCCPAWTVDGKSIIFASAYSTGGPQRRAGYRLWLYQFATSEQRLIWESNVPFRFLGLDEPGSNALIAQAADPADTTSTRDAAHVYSVSIQTGAKLKVNTLHNAYFHNIHLSRDGRTIAFVSRRDNTTALWTVPVNGVTPKELLSENDPKILISSLAWSADGRSIGFGKQTRTNLLSMLTK